MNHTNAVEAAIEAAGARLTDADKPLIELARALAKQVDAAGSDGPGTRLAGTYLTTVRTLAARIGHVAGESPASVLVSLRTGAERRHGARSRRAG